MTITTQGDVATMRDSGLAIPKLTPTAAQLFEIEILTFLNNIKVIEMFLTEISFYLSLPNIQAN